MENGAMVKAWLEWLDRKQREEEEAMTSEESEAIFRIDKEADKRRAYLPESEHTPGKGERWFDLRDSMWWLEGSKWRVVFHLVWLGRRYRLGRYGLVVIKRVPRGEQTR